VSDVDADLVAHFDLRGGYLKPSEGDTKLALIAPMIADDLAKAGVTP
jgi:hypothetical protein